MYSPLVTADDPFMLAYAPALAVDMTARNMQDVVKKKGHPWSAVKGFDTFTPIRFACFSPRAPRSLPPLTAAWQRVHPQGRRV